MFAATDGVIAQALPIHGALDPWLVLLWLGLMAGCLLVVIALTALIQLAITRYRRRAQRFPMAHRESEI